MRKANGVVLNVATLTGIGAARMACRRCRFVAQRRGGADVTRHAAVAVHAGRMREDPDVPNIVISRGMTGVALLSRRNVVHCLNISAPFNSWTTMAALAVIRGSR